MDARNINLKINSRMIELAGGVIPLAFQSRVTKANYFKEALFDYSIEKLVDTADNKTVVEEISYIFSRLNEQFSSQTERNDFYMQYVFAIINAYGELTGTNLTWEEVRENIEGEYPRIENGYLKTTDKISNEDTAIWLFRQYEKSLKEKQTKDEKENKHQKTKSGKRIIFNIRI